MNTIKIIAKVRFNQGFGWVFNEIPNLIYEEHEIDGTRYLVGISGPFFSMFYHQPSSFDAFAGREFELEMKSGEKRKIKDCWWAGNDQAVAAKLGLETVTITCNTKKSLQNCYVFTSVSIIKDVLDDCVVEYEREKGYYYDYYDYEAVIKYKSERMKHIKQQIKLERAIKHLRRNCKNLAALSPKLTYM